MIASGPQSSAEVGPQEACLKVSAVKKRKAQDCDEGDGTRRKRLFKGPKVGSRPIIEGRLSWGDDRKGKKARFLLDSGAEVPLLSGDFVSKHTVPKVKRDVPRQVFDAANQLMTGMGEAFTFPIEVIFGTHVSSVSFEIGPLDDEVDAILPFWWIAKHPPTGLLENRGLKFDSPKCARCTRENAESISFEYDESILDPAYLDSVMVCGVVRSDPPDGKPDSDEASIKARLPAPYHEFLSVFSKEVAEALPPNREWDHAIDLKEGEQPPWGPIYALSEKELTALREYLDDMLRTGKIRPSKSPAGAPILFVPKPHGRGLRLCVDYRGLNKVTVLNRYPLPLISELKDRVQGARLFTRIDLKNGYNLVRIKKGDEWKTAFRTRYGHFEYLVMPMGLTNAPATFQGFINSILKDLIDLGVIVYIDDILIYSETEEEHVRLVREVLSRLKEYGLAAAPDKCEFHKNRLDFLGFVISDEGVEMAQDKIQDILSWESPKNVKDVQVFIGFANFYRRFINGFSRICRPITDTLKGSGKDFAWSVECELAFRRLKHLFTTAPILRHYDPKLPIMMETDASDFAIGAALSQQHGKHWHPVAFHSRKMSPAEMNYEVHDKELLAIVSAFKEWRRYCEGAQHQILIYADHKNLEYFTTTKVLNRRQARWAQELAEYHFKIIYRKGTQNGKPDALSRRPEYRPQGGDGAELQPIHRVLKPENVDMGSLSERAVVSAATLKQKTAVSFAKALLDKVKATGRKDQVYMDRLRDAEAKAEGPDTVSDGVLFYKGRLYVPDDKGLKQHIASSEHDVKSAGHFGMDKTHELLARNFYWPKMDEWVADYVSSCPTCQKTKARRHAKYGKLAPLEVPYAPWTSISMDFITHLPVSDGYDSLWVIVDRFTKMAHFIPLKPPAGSKELASIFVKEIWRLHGLPSEIISDRDSRFTSGFWNSIMELLEIKSKMSTAFHPQTDGQTERTNQTIEAFLRAYCCEDQSDWASLLPWAEYSYNNSVTSATGCSPFYANYGYHPRTQWPKEGEVQNPTSLNYAHWLKSIHEGVTKSLEATRERMGKYYDKRHGEAPQFKKGDLVMLDGRNIKTKKPSKKLDFKLLGPFRVERAISGHAGSVTACQLSLPQSWKIHPVFHVSLLEPYRTAKISGRDAVDPDEVLRQADEVQPEEEAAEEYEVLSIMDSSDQVDADRKVYYHVQWDGYPRKKDWTWEPFEHLVRVKHLVLDFHAKNPKKPRDRRARR